MNKILKSIFILVFVCTCFQLLSIKVDALDENEYKTVTNNSIIYVVEEDGSFSHSWQFNKEQYKDDIDFSLNLLNNSSCRDKINDYINSDIERQYLFFEYHGNLPTTALMKVRVDNKFSDGDKLYLYYYNDATGKLEYVDRNLTVKNGAVEFEIEHCSDYILTGSIVKKAMDNPQSMGIVIISLIILGVILVATTLFMNSKK